MISGKLIRLFSWLFSSNWLTKQLFNIEIGPNPYSKYPKWDLTTLLLKKALNQFVRNNITLLEVGTGYLAILSTYIAKKKTVEITAIDINANFLANARRTAKRNHVEITFRESDLFSNVEGTFDLVFFNPPYVPTNYVLTHQKGRYTNSIFDLVWNGGIDGCETIKRFLKDVEKVIQKDSTILLGVNSLFVKQSKMKAYIHRTNLKLTSIIASKWNPAKVYVLKMK